MSLQEHKAEITALVRHGLTIVGGILIAKGTVDPETWIEVVGFSMAAVGIIFSMLDKRNTRYKEDLLIEQVNIMTSNIERTRNDSKGK